MNLVVFKETQGPPAASEPDGFWVKNYLENGLKLPKMQKIYILYISIVFEERELKKYDNIPSVIKYTICNIVHWIYSIYAFISY